MPHGKTPKDAPLKYCRCLVCAYWQEESEYNDRGWCKKHAPFPARRGVSVRYGFDYYYPIWPKTDRYEGCFEGFATEYDHGE